MGILMYKLGRLDEAEKQARELVSERSETDPLYIAGKKLLNAIEEARRKKAAEEPAPKGDGGNDKSP